MIRTRFFILDEAQLFGKFEQFNYLIFRRQSAENRTLKNFIERS